jgi:hypothetical protein
MINMDGAFIQQRFKKVTPTVNIPPKIMKKLVFLQGCVIELLSMNSEVVFIFFLFDENRDLAYNSPSALRRVARPTPGWHQGRTCILWPKASQGDPIQSGRPLLRLMHMRRLHTRRMVPLSLVLPKSEPVDINPVIH